MFQQVISVALLSMMAASPSAASQGIRSGSCLDCNKVVMTVPASLVLVATPYSSSPADSATMVQLGVAFRDRMGKAVNGSDWRVVTTVEMNTNLSKFGYGTDVVLSPQAAAALASTLNAKVLVMTTITKGSDGHYNATLRVISVPGDAGQVIKLAQAAGQSLPDFGGKLADQAKIVFTAYADAKQCTSNETVNAAKAADFAAKAEKTVPNYGAAEYCLGEMAQAKDSASVEAQKHFRNALVGDPLSLRSIQGIAAVDIKRNDSTAVVTDFQQMITMAPTDQRIADAAFHVFTVYGHPEAASQVVAQQIALDPANPDWQDLQGKSCLFDGFNEKDPAKQRIKFNCASTAFGKEYSLDPTRADSGLFDQALFVAPNATDSMVWIKRYIEKYPSNTTPLKTELSIYMSTNQLDSAAKLASIITRIDPSDLTPLLALEQSYLNAHREDDAIAIGATILKAGDDGSKAKYAGLLVTFADSASKRAGDTTKVRNPQDDSIMIKLGRAIVAADPVNKQWIDYANYFQVLALGRPFAPMATAIRTSKSCDEIKAYGAYLDQLEAPATALTGSATPSFVTYGTQVMGQVASEKKVVPQLLAVNKCQ